jgi:hypothetical protein
MYVSVSNFIVVLITFVMPLVPAIYMQNHAVGPKEWVFAILKFLKQNTFWLLLGGTLFGFFIVTGYYLITAPSQFIHQTITMQAGRTFSEFPSFVGLLTGITIAPAFLKMAFIPVLFTIPLVIIIFRKNDSSYADVFICVALIFTFVFCQFLYQLPRYYIATYIFVYLGIASFVPVLDMGILKKKFKDISSEITIRLLAMAAVVTLSLCLTLVLLTNYTGYDTGSKWVSTNEESVYTETANFLEHAGAQKIYATNPIFPAWSSKLNSTLKFDSYELLWFEDLVPEDMVEARIAEGVDYIVIDGWVRWWGTPYKTQIDKLVQAVRRHGRLVKVIAAGYFRYL